MIITCQGSRSQLVMNSDSMARTAPSPSKIAPKASAARISHRNMHEMASVLRAVSLMQVPVQPAFHRCGEGRRGGADRGALHEAGDAHDEQAGHEEEDEERDDAGPQQLQLLASGMFSSSSVTTGASAGLMRQRITT